MSYSLENAQKFKWSSISGELIPERLSHLEKYITGKKILEAGCGGGAYVDYLSSQNLDVTGIDLHNDFLQLAKNQGRKGSYIRCDIVDIPFPDKFFDCTYCFDVLEHVDDKKAIKELARVTEKRLILTVPRKDEIMYQYGLTFTSYQDPTHLRYYTEQSLEKLCEYINPVDVQIFSEGILPARNVIEELIEFDNISIKSIYGIKIPKHLINDELIAKLYRLIIKKIFDKTAFKKINFGILAIVDLSK